MKVTFANFGSNLASSRLRAAIPQRELSKLGVALGRDVLIYGKHWLGYQEVMQFKKRIYDVCDDHFDNANGDYYRKHIKKADLVTCNSEAMKKRIKEETGRDALIVLEPYESEEKEPLIGPDLFWYGHKSNLPDLERIAPLLRHPLMVMTNHPDYQAWDRQSFDRIMDSPCIVIIPTGKSLAKSENRMVEAIRNGKYVCAEHLPSYEQFDQFFPLGDIPSHIEKALGDTKQAVRRITEAQSYIRDKYSPESIGRQWLEVIQWL